jgi:hypothetical protein
MFRIYQDKKSTDIHIDDVQKVVVEEITEHRQAGSYFRTVSIFTDNGTYCINLEGSEETLALKEAEPDEVRF